VNNSNSIDREQSFLTGIQSSGSRWSAAPSIRKIGRKTAEEVGGARTCSGIPSWVERIGQGCGRKDVSWHNVRATEEILRNSSTEGFRDAGAF